MRRLYFSGNTVMSYSRDFLREQLAKRNAKPHPAILAEVQSIARHYEMMPNSLME